MAESLAVTSDHSEMPYVKELHVKSFALIFALIFALTFASCDNNTVTIYTDHSEMVFALIFALIFALTFASCDNNTLTIYTDHSEMAKCKGVHENTLPCRFLLDYYFHND